MTIGRTTAWLWTAFAVVSALVFAIGSTERALDMLGVWFAVGLLDAVLAGMLLWRHGVSIAMPIVIAVYVIDNRWLLFYLFLAVIFFPKAAP